MKEASIISDFFINTKLRKADMTVKGIILKAKSM
jgi:hypothetical protein